ncbi:NAD(P)-binding protein [Apiospora arundinis]|uniref:NAD(P)-binding protein n=1 Tax=Apiospora arundinis TaxID=335852 RepID=A0ABR2HMA4_9PEZI
MRAWTSTKTGLQLDAHRPSPAPAASAVPGAHLLLRVRYAGLNPADLALMATFPAWLPWRRNPIVGLDFVGEVIAAGPQAAQASSSPDVAKAGTLVCGALGVRQAFFGAGTLGEVLMVPADLVAAVPQRFLSARNGGGEGESIRAAVAMGVTGQTAALVLREAEARGKGRIAEWAGKRVLVNGASGGVGSILVHVLKNRGAHVVGVCSGANEEMVRKLGADEVIDYKVHQDVYGFIAESTPKDQQFDLVVDCVGDDNLYTRCLGYLKLEGRFLCITGGPSQGVYPFLMHQIRPVFLGGTPRSYKILGMGPSGAGAREVADWAEKGYLKEVAIDSEFTMDEVPKAYERVESKRARGKVVIRISE